MRDPKLLVLSLALLSACEGRPANVTVADYAVRKARESKGPRHGRDKGARGQREEAASAGDPGHHGGNVPQEAPVAPVGFTVGGTVVGLPAGKQVVLTDELEQLTVSANGGFVFPQAMEDHVLYMVRIVEQPAGAICSLSTMMGEIDGANVTDLVLSCVATSCANRGWKRGDGDWSCPAGYRMPNELDAAIVAPCVTSNDAQQIASLGMYGGIATSVGGCGCDWNESFCDAPSIDVIGGGRMCGDYSQLQVCVVE